MIDRIAYFVTDNTNPYQNLAVEETLLHMVEPGQIIMYLWQNQHTVVIGKNQNARAECKMDLLEEEGGYLARRMSGGGAVYHDLGNLNFTFVVRQEDYNVARQCRVLLEAVRSFGIMAEQTGRNDILVNGKKFSGNSYYQNGDLCFHNGTIMVNVDMERLPRYLNVSMEKMQSKGIKSVKSRVTNLSSVNKAITIESMKEAMIKAFEWVYGLEAKKLSRNEIPAAEVARNTEKFASEEWKTGRQYDFSFELHRRFDWGDVTICPQIENGQIQKCEIYSDALDADFITAISEMLTGTVFAKQEMLEALVSESANGIQEQMLEDIKALIRDSF